MPSQIKKRLDVLLVERALFATRAKAQAAVLAGEVWVEGKMVDKAGVGVPENAAIEVKRKGEEFVSRGGKKLDAAMKHFGVDVKNKVCLDVGASTGGFTDCLIKYGAARVYALDVGYGLLDEKLRKDERVRILERVNVRFARKEMFEEAPDFAVVDVAFISLKLVLPVLKELGIKDLLALVKPQFEAGKKEVRKGGVVRDPAVQQRAVSGIADTAKGLGYEVKGVFESPLKGPKGNREFFLRLVSG